MAIEVEPADDTPPEAQATATVEPLTPVDFQMKLMAHGFDLPEFGADGYWGDETATAAEEWFEVGGDLNAPSPTVPAPEPPGESTVPSGIVPPEWMPDCKMSKIIVHWTAGSHTCSAVDKEHYHIIVDGNGKLWRGDNSIKANVSTSDSDGYAAHTKSCNTGSIGISACCMANAVESPFNPGSYPLKPIQWETLAAVAADLCNEYGIPVTPTTVLQHGEVQKNLGITQDGKWDIGKLPWASSLSSKEVGDQFREMVKAYNVV